MRNLKIELRRACFALLIFCNVPVFADGGFNGVFGLRFDGTFDPAPSCIFNDIAFIFMEELDSVLMWEGDALAVNVVIDEVCFDNVTFEATFRYSMTTPDTDYLQGATAEFTLSGLASGGSQVAQTNDNGLIDGSRILLVSRDNVAVTGAFAIDSLRDPNALSVEIIDPPNQAPIAANDQASTIINRPTAIPVLANDIDPNPGDNLTITSFTQPATGEVQRDQNVLVYTPPADSTAITTFNYVASDGTLPSNMATVTVSVITREADLLFEENNEE